jgi:hypothetical protein
MEVTHVLPNEQDRPSNIIEIFDSPDDIGATEYRIVYELLEELNISEPDEAVSVLEETVAWASYMITKIRESYPLSEETT